MDVELCHCRTSTIANIADVGLNFQAVVPAKLTAAQFHCTKTEVRVAETMAKRIESLVGNLPPAGLASTWAIPLRPSTSRMVVEERLLPWICWKADRQTSRW